MPLQQARTALYRLLAMNGRLLYVGISGNPDVRWGAHSNRQPWWSQVADRKLEWFETRSEALIAEEVAIQEERPLYNIQHAAKDAQGAAGCALPPMGGYLGFPLKDIPAERAILGAMIISSAVIADIAGLLGDKNVFYEAWNRYLYKVILSLWRTGVDVDMGAAKDLATRGFDSETRELALLHLDAVGRAAVKPEIATRLALAVRVIAKNLQAATVTGELARLPKRQIDMLLRRLDARHQEWSAAMRLEISEARQACPESYDKHVLISIALHQGKLTSADLETTVSGWEVPV